jgi:hypothetical protein
MHDTTVKMKAEYGGQVYCGPIWEWKPKEGWFTLTDAVVGLVTIRLEAVESAITKGQRVSINSPPEGEDQDELARAKRDGWTS